MSIPHACKFVHIAAVLTVVFILANSAMAMGGYGADQLVKGEVQSIDYLQHTITVNGRTYRVSPQAKFNGIGAFSVLHVGMPVQLMLGNASDTSTAAPSSPNDVKPENATSSVVIQVTWMPNGV